MVSGFLSNSARGVNTSSRWLVSLIVAIALCNPSLASADRVTVMPLGGRAEQPRLDEIHGLLEAILREQGHRLVPPGESTVAHPPTSAQMAAAAEALSSNYILVGEVEPLPGQYRFQVHVFYVASGRFEELVVTVLHTEERARLSDILSSMVRAEGLGEDAIRLTADDDELSEEERRLAAERAAEEAAQREAEEAARLEAAEAARLEEEARLRAEAEAAAEAAQTEQEAWDNRPQYGTDGAWMLQIGAGGRYAIGFANLPSGLQGGGGLFDAGIRIGRTFEGVDGFELRGGVDFMTGVFTGLGVHIGAAYLASVLLEPFYVGFLGEVGAVFTFTGGRDVGFSGRISALFAFRPTEHFYLEVSLPEVGVVTPGTGALSLGASGRLGYRF